MEVINCKIIMISKPTTKHFYFFLFLIGAIFRLLVPDIIKKLNGEYDKENKKSPCLKHLLTKQYLEIIGNLLSDLLMGIPHFCYKVRNKDDYKSRKQKTYNSNVQRIRFIYNEEKSHLPNMLRIIFIISLVDVICQLTIPIKYIFENKVLGRKQILNVENYHLYFLLFFDIFARYFFSRVILKTYFYIHHKLSFLLNIIGLIPIAIVDFHLKFKENENGHYFDILFVSVISVQLILYSFEDIMNKVAFNALSILPCTLMFYNGLFQLCFFIITSLLFFLLNLYDFSDINYKHEIQNYLGFIPFNILRNLYLVKVIDKFSAQHMALLKVSESALIYLYCKLGEVSGIRKEIFKLQPWHYAVQGIGFSFLFISSLIHNELIIINHPKLKAKTEYYLNKDADKEQNTTFTTDTFFSTSKETGSNLYDDLTGSDIS